MGWARLQRLRCAGIRTSCFAEGERVVGQRQRTGVGHPSFMEGLCSASLAHALPKIRHPSALQAFFIRPGSLPETFHEAFLPPWRDVGRETPHERQQYCSTRIPSRSEPHARHRCCTGQHRGSRPSPDPALGRYCHHHHIKKA